MTRAGGTAAELRVVAAIVGQNPRHVIQGLGEGRNAAVAVYGIRTRVVGRQGASQIAAAIEQLAQVTGTRLDVLAGVKGIVDAQIARGPRHQLHQPLGANPREGPGLEIRLGRDDRLHQRRLQAVVARRSQDQQIEAVFRGGLGPGALAPCEDAPIRLDPLVARVVRGIREVDDAAVVHIAVHRSRCVCGQQKQRYDPGRDRESTHQAVHLPTPSCRHAPAGRLAL